MTRTYAAGQVRGVPMLSPSWLEDGTAGLIALSGATAGDIALSVLAGRLDEARKRLERWSRELLG